MSTPSLRAVTLETVANATRAAERTVGAYRAGGHRLVTVIRSRVASPAADRAEPYAPRLAAALRSTATQAGDLALQGIDSVSSRSEQVIEVASSTVTTQVKTLARLANDVDNRLVANGLDAAARAALPGAQAALALSERLADGAEQLATLAAGPKAKKAAKARKAATPRTAKAPVKAAAQPVKKAAAPQAAQRKTAAKPVAEVVAKAVKTARTAAKTAPKTMEKAVAKTAAKPVRRAAKAVQAAAEAVQAGAAEVAAAV
ncbi:MAG: hypothetical protein KBC73_03540 [Burkholderiaceae bacterium]|nr:hypothetical protein [Burkholderiaceae bacterium]